MSGEAYRSTTVNKNNIVYTDKDFKEPSPVHTSLFSGISFGNIKNIKYEWTSFISLFISVLINSINPQTIVFILMIIFFIFIVIGFIKYLKS